MKCPECGSIAEEVDGPIHEYMISSPGCWKVFCDVLNKEYSDPDFMKVHRLTVDAFACQHVGDDDPRAKQSVMVHLLALHLALDLKLKFSEIPNVMDFAIRELKGKFPKLDRPDFTDVMKVTDVLVAESADEHCRLVTKWAEQVWSAWHHEHARIRDTAEFFRR